MKIFVDADACPVVHIVEKLAKKYEIPCKLLCDTNHVLRSDYSDVIVVGAGADAVDFKLISLLHRGDIACLKTMELQLWHLEKDVMRFIRVGNGTQTRILIKC